LGGHQNDRQSRKQGAQVLDQCESITVWHVNVTDYGIEFLGGGRGERLGSIPGEAHSKAVERQARLQHEPDRVLVVNNKNVGLSSHRLTR